MRKDAEAWFCLLRGVSVVFLGRFDLLTTFSHAALISLHAHDVLCFGWLFARARAVVSRFIGALDARGQVACVLLGA